MAVSKCEAVCCRHGRKGKGSWRAWKQSPDCPEAEPCCETPAVHMEGKTAAMALAFCQQCSTCRDPFCAAASVVELCCDTHDVQKGLAGCCQRLGLPPPMLLTCCNHVCCRPCG